MGTGLGAVFVRWLIFSSLYRIDALCPYCMLVWVVTATALVAVLARWSTVGAHGWRVATYASSLVVAWTLLVAGLIAIRFWDYWATLL